MRTYRQAVAAALPQVQHLDGRGLAAERGPDGVLGGTKGATALQHLAAMQLQAFSQVAFRIRLCLTEARLLGVHPS